MQEGTLCMNIQHCTCMNLTKGAHWVCIATLSVIALTQSWELFTPSIYSIRECVNRVGSWRDLSPHQQSSVWHEITVLWWDRGDPTPQHLCGFNQSQDSCGSFCFGKDHSDIMVPSALFWGLCIAHVCPSQDLVTIWVAVALHFLFQEWVADIYA